MGGGGSGAPNNNRKCVRMFMVHVVGRVIRGCGNAVPGIRNPWRGIQDPRLS